MAYVVTVKLLLDVADDAEAADATNEILRGAQRDFSENSCLVDYAIPSIDEDDFVITDDYEEGDRQLPTTEVVSL